MTKHIDIIVIPNFFLIAEGCGGYKVDCKSSGSPAIKHEVKPLPINFPESVQCSFGDRTGSQARRNAADVPAGPPRKWKHRHINRHFSSTSDHQPEAGRHGPIPETKPHPSPSWLVAEQPVPLSAVCHQGLAVVKKGSPGIVYFIFCILYRIVYCLQCFDTVGRASGRASSP